jgi:F-type H+-transporting ATPase subunit b
MVYVDFTVFIQLIQFLLIFYISKKLILDPTMKNIQTRDSKVNSLLEEAESLKAEVEAGRVGYAQKMDAMRAEMAEYQRKIREEATKSATAKVEQAKADVDAKVEKALAELNKERETAAKNMDALVGELSDLIVQKILKSA